MKPELVDSPEAVKSLAPAELPALAASLRAEIVDVVSKNGGHLASSLGAVELSIALVRVFDPPRDRIVWDVGHQAYAWKMLTGRRAAFPTIRRHGGISGFCNPEESPCDAFVSGHAGAAISAAEGMAAARDLAGGDGQVVAVVGDASMTNGVSLEALNDCTALAKRLVIVLNDNEMSISKNVGAFSRYLGRLISGVRYNRVKAAAERAGHRLRLTFLRGAYHRLEQTIKSLWLANSFFENLGLRYIGPVDGHNLAAIESALTVAKEDKRPVVVHVVTEKGRGFRPAEANPARWHGVGAFDPAAELERRSAPDGKRDWRAVFGESLMKAAARDPKVCALTAAMKTGTGLVDFAAAHPERFFDVGICEGHLVTFAAGLASSGMKPVVAVYSTFLQRAFDNVMHDVCLGNLPVVFAIDRAGAVGADGRTHHGMFDIPMLRCLPGISILQPMDAAELEAMLGAAFERGGPVAIRWPRGAPPPDSPCPPVEWGKARVICAPEASVMIWALGDQIGKAREVAELIKARGVEAGIVNARFVKPLDRELLRSQAARGALIATVENGALAGGFGEAVRSAVPEAKVLSFGWPDVFVSHGEVAQLERDHRFGASDIALAVLAEIERRGEAR